MDIGNFLTVAPSQCIDQWWRASWSSLIWEFHAERGVCFILQKEGVNATGLIWHARRSTRALPYPSSHRCNQPEKIKGIPRIVHASIPSILSLLKKSFSYMSSAFPHQFPVPYLGTSADNGSSGSYTQIPIIETSGHRSSYVSQLRDWNGCDDITTVSRGEQYVAGTTSFPER
jgi:hypothetical protein